MSTTSEIALVEVRRFFTDYDIDLKGTILVAFSGGADSLALLILLSKLFPLDHLHALYVNHRLRSSVELTQEEQLNQSNCDSLGISLSIVRLENKQVAQLAQERGNGIEEAARILRYKALEQKRIELGFDYIATAHTLDDQIETVLMRLMHGSGPTALQGIAWRQGVVIRPLLNMTRKVIEEVVQEAQLSCATDSTNGDTRYLRNQIRHELIPVVSRLFPQYRESLQQVAQRSKSMVDALAPQIDCAIEEAVSKDGEAVLLDLEQLTKRGAVVVEQVIYHGWNLLEGHLGRRLPYRNVQEICAKIANGWGKRERIMVSGTTIIKENSHLRWQTKASALAEGYASCVYSACIELDGKRQLVVGGEPDGLVPVDRRPRIAEDTLVPPVLARSYQSGDTILLVEGTKKVTSLFADWHIVPEQRWKIPVLEDTLGIFAVLGEAYGGKDRVAKRCLCATLARNSGTLYSVTDREG